ncbi:MAG: carbohydrate-binding family 9-like protein [Massiliimalia sp.]|jgi:hypothetical protein
MEHIIPQVTAFPDWDTIPAIPIDTYSWGGEYRPKAEARICFIPDQGFAVRLCCWEQNPRAVFTENDNMVCQDSCLECFLDFAPENPKIGYLNLEANSKGTQWCQYGVDRHHRTFLREKGIPYPVLTPFMDSQCWGYTAVFPLETIQTIYGKGSFQEGDMLRGNFYKCGDLTQFPHYGSWTKIDWPEPDFHRPEFFGTFILGKAADNIR